LSENPSYTDVWKDYLDITITTAPGYCSPSGTSTLLRASDFLDAYFLIHDIHINLTLDNIKLDGGNNETINSPFIQISGVSAHLNLGLENGNPNVPILANNKRTFNYDGDIVGGAIVASDSSQIVMNSGLITNNAVSNAHRNGYGKGGAIYLNSANTGENPKTSFTMNAGRIINNSASHFGGAFMIETSAWVTINNGEISGNVAENQSLEIGEGGAAFVAGGAATFLMKSGLMSNNRAKLYGGAVCDCWYGVVSFEGGIVENNSVTYTGSVSPAVGGGAICVYQSSALYVTGDTKIKNNTSTGVAGGIYLSNDNAYNNIYFSGNPVVKDNYQVEDENKLESNVYTSGRVQHTDQNYLIYATNLGNGAKIGVTTKVDTSEPPTPEADENFARYDTSAGQEVYAQAFFSDQRDSKGNKLVGQVNTEETGILQWAVDKEPVSRIFNKETKTYDLFKTLKEAVQSVPAGFSDDNRSKAVIEMLADEVITSTTFIDSKDFKEYQDI
ncbi:MAG: hypothetical protein HUJ62_05960, partial [Streptococcus gallolyticus]|nr:hypothetical protein [Streptococcus gallolyticus]